MTEPKKIDAQGREMTRFTYSSRRTSNPKPTITISNNPDAPKEKFGSGPNRTVTRGDTKAAKAEEKASKKAAKIVREVTTESKKPMTSDTREAIKIAADRAKQIPRENRTAAQQRAIATDLRYKNDLQGFKQERESAGDRLSRAIRNVGKPTGTQADHHVTTGRNVSKTIGKGTESGGVLGLALSGMAAYNEETKRIAKMKKEIN